MPMVQRLITTLPGQVGIKAANQRLGFTLRKSRCILERSLSDLNHFSGSMQS